MNDATRLRIGIVGAGENTRLRHIPGLQAIPGVQIDLVCNRRPESSRAVAAEFGIPRVAEQWQQVVEDPEIDAVVIGTWPYLHAPIAVAALTAGKHVLTEARMARNLDEARAMQQAARSRPDRVAQIVPSPLSLDVDSTVQELLQAGTIGELLEVSLVHTQGLYADPEKPLSWRQDIELSGYNTLTLGIYYEIVLRWLKRDPVGLSASASIFAPTRPLSQGGRGEVRIPESLTLAGHYPDGVRLAGHFSGVETGLSRSEIRLNGRAGSLVFSPAKNELWLARPDESKRVEIPAERRRGWRVESDFVDSIRRGTPVQLTDFGTGLAYMRFTEAVWQSWNSESRLVRLDQLGTGGAAG